MKLRIIGTEQTFDVGETRGQTGRFLIFLLDSASGTYLTS